MRIRGTPVFAAIAVAAASALSAHAAETETLRNEKIEASIEAMTGSEPFEYEDGAFDEEDLPEGCILMQAGKRTYAFPPAVTNEWLRDGGEERVLSEVEGLKDECDETPSEVRFTSEDGEEFLLPAEGCGWYLDARETAARLMSAAENGESAVSAAWSNGSERRSGDDVGGNYVEVDVSRQTAFLFENYEKVLETPCVTGCVADGCDTTQGAFTVQGKASPTTLRGYNPDGSLKYASDVTYWMPFHDGEGLHDADGWRSEYGGDIYLNDGSHGCVNLPYAAAEKIYSETWIGFPVVVHE